ncbi:thioesterase II family protein [Nocardiopsis valliformis]|uniref:thioesterase II family protein n=1 Tax=Nocardiopsis valliformis TaxID=239974 RepID=UPI0003457C75|nr:alpha/beta fold hydrolase [Nocardiopsis valliformis]
MDTTWFRRLTTPGDGGTRLICFPHAGGAASYFGPLARELAPEIEVLGVQYPGRQDRRSEAGVESLVELARLIARALADSRPERPFAFFGHSMGALVAFETARHLRRLGSIQPVRLFASGRAAPDIGPIVSDRHDSDEALIEHVGRLGGTARQVFDDPDLRAMVMPAMRADYRALRSYTWVAEEPLDVPICALTGTADPVTEVSQAHTWSRHSTASEHVEVFPGGHFFIDDSLRSVAAVVAAGLEKPDDLTGPMENLENTV